MSIVCLAWGSLVWDPRNLPVVSEWFHDGPLLPIEFCRQSADGRITLVITSDARPLPVFFAELGVKSVDEALSVLAAREGISGQNIYRSVGHWRPNGCSGHDHADIVGQWASERGLDGVVWTALNPKFQNEYRTPSGDEVVRYLRELKGPSRGEAERYVKRTPQQIRTDYRHLIEEALGWAPSQDA